ncbi:hypothetical protein BDW62DRAFT_181801 [Aspergillus aurantiobrunneus]
MPLDGSPRSIPNLPCQLDGGFLNGSYNLCQKFLFDNGTVWLLCLPRVSSISPEYADEKIAMEEEALHLIREKTAAPVPDVYAWALASENPLGLGPFILMSFITGISLNNVLGGPGSRLLREEVPNTDLEYLYRQMARIMLQLFQIEFDRIDGLPTPVTKFPAPVHPLNWKVHDILRVGGVNTFDLHHT